MPYIPCLATPEALTSSVTVLPWLDLPARCALAVLALMPRRSTDLAFAFVPFMKVVTYFTAHGTLATLPYMALVSCLAAGLAFTSFPIMGFVS